MLDDKTRESKEGEKEKEALKKTIDDPLQRKKEEILEKAARKVSSHCLNQSHKPQRD